MYKYASQIPQANPCRLGPTLRRRSKTNVGSAAPKFTHIGKWETAIACRGQACCPSVDNIMIAISYASIVLALYS